MEDTAKRPVPLTVYAAVIAMLAGWLLFEVNQFLVEWPPLTRANPWTYPITLLFRLIPVSFYARAILRKERWAWWLTLLFGVPSLLFLAWSGPGLVLRPSNPQPFFANTAMYFAVLAISGVEFACLLTPTSLRAFGIVQPRIQKATPG